VGETRVDLLHFLEDLRDAYPGAAEETPRTSPSVAESAVPPASEAVVPSTGGARRPARYGLSIQFEAKPDDAELARLVETTIWINEAHPAYRRAAASRS